MFANSCTTSSARKKYGIACRNVQTGRVESNTPLRRQPARIPNSVPSAKLMIVAVPTSAIVQGSVLFSTVTTFSGYSSVEMPRLPWARWPR